MIQRWRSIGQRIVAVGHIGARLGDVQRVETVHIAQFLRTEFGSDRLLTGSDTGHRHSGLDFLIGSHRTAQFNVIRFDKEFV